MRITEKIELKTFLFSFINKIGRILLFQVNFKINESVNMSVDMKRKVKESQTSSKSHIHTTTKVKEKKSLIT